MTDNLSPLVPKSDRKSDVIELRGFLCQGVLVGSLRDSYRIWRHQMSVVLVAVDGGFVIRAVLGNQKSGVFVMAEHSQQMRIFKRADSALAVCRKIGLAVVGVEL